MEAPIPFLKVNQSPRPYQKTIIDRIFRAFVSYLDQNNLLTKESKSRKRIAEIAEHVRSMARM